MTLAGDGTFIWFITGAPLTHATKSLTGFIKCWDATALTNRLRKPLTSRLTEIESGCNKAFSRKTAAEASGRQHLVELAERDMNVEARGFAESCSSLEYNEGLILASKGRKFRPYPANFSLRMGRLSERFIVT